MNRTERLRTPVRYAARHIARFRTSKPKEVRDPYLDIRSPQALLSENWMLDNVRIMEAHAALVAKALGGGLEKIEPYFARRPDPRRLCELLERAKPELEDYEYRVAAARLARYTGGACQTG